MTFPSSALNDGGEGGACVGSVVVDWLEEDCVGITELGVLERGALDDVGTESAVAEMTICPATSGDV